MMNVEDDVLLDIVSGELKALLKIDAKPLFHRIFRWPRANPQYDVGHLDRLMEIEASLPRQLYLTGSPYRGIGLPDCIRQGKETAHRLIDQLQDDGTPLKETQLDAGIGATGKVPA
jgi:oxygen-dependent protoporphyrinogen oxidase